MDAILDVFRSAAQGDMRSVFLLVALYVLGAALYSLYLQWQADGWVKTRGRLVRGGSGKFGVRAITLGSKDHPPNALFEYEVDGQRHFGTRASPWGSVASHTLRLIFDRQFRNVGLDASGAVDVYYNPRNPAQSVLMRTGMVSRAILAFLGATPIVLYLVHYGWQA